ncbi:MAG: DUF4239 domain-containing protein [Nitrospira sp.]|nr:DUF4239 domain-containing protein [Nitrospira sp.]
MTYLFKEMLLAGGLFLGMLLFFELGRQYGVARRRRDPVGAEKGSGPVEAAIFGLLGLLLAFTFSGAASRFEDRRHLITEEANTIGTAYLRIDLLPPDTQPAIRQLFVRYLNTRTDAYRNAEDVTTTNTKASETAAIQGEIWSKAVAALHRPDTATQAAILVIPALNAMIDIATTRGTAMQNHPPHVVFVLLAALSLTSALLAGHVMCRTTVRSWFYMLLFAGAMSVTFFVILDLEYPRFGLIRIDEADQVLIELHNLVR